ncbi:unnamed protein product [Nippostrongylus brasiliensis]|uniref:RNase H domain-containing protein n=1 Tax=Nippostrongylus brasiliensis TaxID=27835 RepID=A0A0N4Y9G5_NIPBR|nr:unnamed protein product [Nippostrongylus brasiliensis]
MAFYFALLNVSAKRDDRTASTASHRQKRRRHSIASVESPVLDYRLLPKPQIVRNEFYYGEQKNDDRHSTYDFLPPEQPQNNRSASTSRSNDVRTDDHDGRRNCPRNVKDRGYPKGMRKSDSTQLNASRKPKQRNESRERKARTPELLEREFCGMQVASSSTRRPEPETFKRMNGSTEVRAGVAHPEFEKKWRGKRPIVVKRRVSPQESSTSDSRRSSNQSNRSPQRNDSLASSTSSRRTSEAIPEVLSAVGTPNEVPNVTTPQNVCELPRSATLKKVTFENDSSQYLTAALVGVAFGAALRAPLSGYAEETPRRQNDVNHAIEQISIRRCCIDGAGIIIAKIAAQAEFELASRAFPGHLAI